MKFLAIIVALFAGLQAVSGAEDCPFDCNSRGTCQDDGTCLCDPGTFGFDCHDPRMWASVDVRRR